MQTKNEETTMGVEIYKNRKELIQP